MLTYNIAPIDGNFQSAPQSFENLMRGIERLNNPRGWIVRQGNRFMNANTLLALVTVGKETETEVLKGFTPKYSQAVSDYYQVKNGKTDRWYFSG